MIKYYCEICDDYVSNDRFRDENQNKCLECKERIDDLKIKFKNGLIGEEKLNSAIKEYEESSLKQESEIYWCENCNIPIFNQSCDICGNHGEYLSTDVRPVFPEEQLLLDILTDFQHSIVGNSVWYTSGNQYIKNGETLNFSKSDLVISKATDHRRLAEVRKQLKNQEEKINYDNFNEIIKKFVEANRNRINKNVIEAENYIRTVSDSYSEDEIFISFSGGKDSTVLHDLVTKTLSNKRVFRLFGDTTLEFAKTYEYVERIKSDTRHLPFLTAKNRNDDFYDLFDEIGPPSRMMRWCCTFFKTGVISRRIDRIYKNKNKILSFQGIRRVESVSRSNYLKESDSPKIAKQKVSSPIIDWLDFDVWLYIFSKNIDFNETYKLGYSRVGCWCCPNNGLWDEFLSKIYYPEDSKEFYNKIVQFSEITNKNNIDDYVYNGKWKARQGGQGVKKSEDIFLEFEPCVNESNSFSYELSRPISEDLFTLFKPFGYINKNIGNSRKGEVFILDNNDNPIMSLQGRKGQKILKVTIYNFNFAGLKNKIKNINDARNKIENQLTKYQICVGCGGCIGVCNYNAIKINKKELNKGNSTDNIKYLIDENHCVKCGDCVDHFDGGCYMKKVLRIKRRD